MFKSYLNYDFNYHLGCDLYLVYIIYVLLAFGFKFMY